MKASLSGHKRIVNLLLTADRPAQPMTANKVSGESRGATPHLEVLWA